MSEGKSGRSTRERLLEAAGQVIAEKGYHAATVREICQRAGANVAAVNYHFGDKERLYTAVLRHVLEHALKKHPVDRARLMTKPPRERLREFVRAFLVRRLDTERPAWHRRIMAVEVGEPSKTLQKLMRKMVRQNMSFFRELVGELIGGRADEQTVELCIASVMGQCVYYSVTQHLIPRVYKRIRLTPSGIRRIADHIAEFSLGGVAAVAPRRGGNRKKRLRKGS
jgi:AcrR family transcriptional regulator